MEEKNISKSVTLETRGHKIMRVSAKYMPIFLVVLIIAAIFINVSEESLFTLGKMSDIICWTLYGIVLFFSIVEIVLFLILRNLDNKNDVKIKVNDDDN